MRERGAATSSGTLERLFGLTGRAALVTGGARGIGKAIALLLAELGACVAVADLNKAGAESTAQEMEKGGPRALAMEADVTDRAQVDAAVDGDSLCWGQLCAKLACAKGDLCFSN